MGIVYKSGIERCLDRFAASGDQTPGNRKPFLQDELMERLAGILPEQSGQIIFADEKLAGQKIEGQVVLQMLIDVADNGIDFRMIADIHLFDLIAALIGPVEIDQKLADQTFLKRAFAKVVLSAFD